MRLLLAALIPFLALAATPDETTYNALVKRAKEGDRKVDYHLMRMTCMRIDKCRPRATRAELLKLADRSDMRKAVEYGETLLGTGFVNAEVHATLAGMYQALGEGAKSRQHAEIATALIQSIVTSGDGKTAGTAYVIISDREQYITLNALGLPYAGAGVVKQDSLTVNGRKVNRWQVKPPNATVRTVFFNTDLFTAKSVVDK